MPKIPIGRRRFLIATGATGAVAGAGLLRPSRALANTGPQSYTASWASVDQHPPAPTWFQDAKFGIYFHWGGVQSSRVRRRVVPAPDVRPR
jgi:alpha-L-fucosidase